jgi:hypothetical protein
VTRRQRIRRVALLCVHAICNFAYYRGGRQGNRLVRSEQFWIRANGNFLDIGLLEWCKLFADPRGSHYWEKVISNPAEFKKLLLENCSVSSSDWEKYCTEVREYRDKFVAHLDSELVAHIPSLAIAIDSTRFLLSYLNLNENQDGCFVGIQMNANRLYRAETAIARRNYANPSAE